MSSYSETVLGTSTIPLGNLVTLIGTKIKDHSLKKHFNETEIQWLRDHASKLPVILKDNSMCRILKIISDNESINSYQIAKELSLDKVHVWRRTKLLTEVGLINTQTINFLNSGKPCYVQEDTLNITLLILDLANNFYGISFQQQRKAI